jgi:hypothetical protein
MLKALSTHKIILTIITVEAVVAATTTTSKE